MKQLLIVKTHSFVDVITNSSTELFVADTEKTVDQVKELLQEKWQDFKKLWGESISESDDVFDFLEVKLIDSKFLDQVKKETEENGEWGYYLDGYDVKYEEGNIFIEGTSDNSIPYEFWDVIEKFFNATRYHLG